MDEVRRRWVLIPLMAGMAASVRAVATNEAKRMFKWLPTECAPANYPMYLVRGALGLQGGGQVAVPDQRNVHNGWGLWGSTHIVGDMVKPVPQRLEISWFSYAEDRFFQGAFALPTEAMTTYFARGIPEDRATRKPAPFERIIVGMAPEGCVSVWMAGGAEVVEVANFQAAPADLPWTKVLDNPDITRAVFIRLNLEKRLGAEGYARLQRLGIPRGLFQSYRTLYRWQPWVTGAGKPDGVRIRSLNGENAFIGQKGAAIPRDMRPLPAEIELYWTSPEGTPLLARIIFDEAETEASFQKLSRGSAATQLALHLEISSAGVGVSLRDEKFILPQHKATVRVLKQ